MHRMPFEIHLVQLKSDLKNHNILHCSDQLRWLYQSISGPTYCCPKPILFVRISNILQPIGKTKKQYSVTKGLVLLISSLQVLVYFILQRSKISAKSSEEHTSELQSQFHL